MSRVSAVLIVILATFRLGTATPPVDIPKPAQVREKAALALIPFPWRQLQYDIVFMAPRHGIRGMTIPDEHRIEIYARPGDDARLLAYDIAHELGHAIDMTFNTAPARKRWMKVRGIDPATPWFGCSECSDFNTPAGDFAETFALFLLGPGHFSGLIAPPPAVAQIPALASFFPTHNSYLQRLRGTPHRLDGKSSVARPVRKMVLLQRSLVEVQARSRCTLVQFG
jgi:hypothetical protein